MNLTESEWICTGESRLLIWATYAPPKLQQKWTRKVTKPIESDIDIYQGMTINETEVEWRDVPVVEE